MNAKHKTRDMFVWNSENGYYVISPHKNRPDKFPSLFNSGDGWKENFPAEFFPSAKCAREWLVANRHLLPTDEEWISQHRQVLEVPKKKSFWKRIFS